jgi:MFS family permease
VLLGGVLTEGPGWRWVMFVNPIACALVLVPVFRLIEGEQRRRRLVNFDAVGAVLITGGMLLLVYALVRAPIVGWGSARTVGELAGAGALLGLFVLNELRQRAPLAPLEIFRINGLGFANVTQLVAFAGFLALFFFLTLYMQNVLGYSAIQTGLAYLPLCFVVALSAGVSSQLLSRVGTRPVMVVGAIVAAGGLYWLSRIPVDGSYLADLLPGTLVLAVGGGGVFVGVTTAANAGVPADKAGLAAALLNASQQLGGALGLAIFTAVSTSHTNHLLAGGASASHALTAGFQRALLIGSIFVLAAAATALAATNTRGEAEPPAIVEAEPARAA